MIHSLAEIYASANVLKYDVSASMTGEVFTTVQNDIESYALIYPESNVLFAHKYEPDKQTAVYKGSVVWLHGDVKLFLNSPEIGDYPDFLNRPTLKDYVDKYPYIYDKESQSFKEFYENSYDATYDFSMWLTKSVADKLHAEIGSFVDAYVREGFVNTATFPVEGITNIFSNNGDSIYILPRPAKSAIFTDAIKSRRYQHSYFNVIMNLKEGVDHTDFLRKLESFIDEDNRKVYNIGVQDKTNTRKEIGELNTKINQFLRSMYFSIYIILLLAAYTCKYKDDQLSQVNNFKAYYHMGIMDSDAREAMNVLNRITFIIGGALCFIIVLLLKHRITDIMYNLMEVIR